MRPIDPDQFVESLDFSDRFQFCRSWHKLIFKGTIRRVPNVLLEAAFAALTHWGRFPTTESERDTGACILGVFRTIRQGITERPDCAEQLAARIAEYCLSPNLDVAAGAIRQFERLTIDENDIQLDQFRDLATTTLRSVANHRRQRPRSTAMTLRGLAFHVLYELDPSVLTCRELKDSRHECAQGYFKWAAESSWRVDEMLLKANTFIWYS